jgi:hypothetical protein
MWTSLGSSISKPFAAALDVFGRLALGFISSGTSYFGFFSVTFGAPNAFRSCFTGSAFLGYLVVSLVGSVDFSFLGGAVLIIGYCFSVTGFEEVEP